MSTLRSDRGPATVVQEYRELKREDRSVILLFEIPNRLIAVGSDGAVVASIVAPEFEEGEVYFFNRAAHEEKISKTLARQGRKVRFIPGPFADHRGRSSGPEPAVYRHAG